MNATGDWIHTLSDGELGLHRWVSLDQSSRQESQSRRDAMYRAEGLLHELHAPAASMPGVCTLCALATRFRIVSLDRPNWREDLVCESCGLYSRIRLALTLFERLVRGSSDPIVYLTEQASPTYAWLRRRYRRTIGSDYVHDGESRERLQTYLDHLLKPDRVPVRHEDATALRLSNASVDAVLSFEVLEHVADHRAALGEFARVLRPGGLLLISVPFAHGHAESILRARRTEDGRIEHLVEPEYHGDPAANAGCLAFHTFGWDLLDHIRASGFSDVALVDAWSPSLGILGRSGVIEARRD